MAFNFVLKNRKKIGKDVCGVRDPRSVDVVGSGSVKFLAPLLQADFGLYT